MPETPSTNGRHEDELRMFFEMSIDMLCIADVEGYFKRINAAWQSTLGYSTEELSAVPYIDFVHPDDREKTLAEAGRLKVGMDTISFENRYRCKDGSYKWLLWRAHADFDTKLIYAVARDITKLVAVNDEYQESERRLAELIDEWERAETGASSAKR